MDPKLHDALQDAMNRAAEKCPSVGKTVRVITGKHMNVIGKVIWHGINKFDNPFRYGDFYQHCMTEAFGTYGYRVRIQPEDGSACFFVDADKVEIQGQQPEAEK